MAGSDLLLIAGLGWFAFAIAACVAVLLTALAVGVRGALLGAVHSRRMTVTCLETSKAQVRKVS